MTALDPTPEIAAVRASRQIGAQGASYPAEPVERLIAAVEATDSLPQAQVDAAADAYRIAKAWAPLTAWHSEQWARPTDTIEASAARGNTSDGEYVDRLTRHCCGAFRPGADGPRFACDLEPAHADPDLGTPTNHRAHDSRGHVLAEWEAK